MAHITNHVDLALEDLLGQFDQSEDLQGFITVFVEQLQDAEDALQDMHNLRSIDNSEGKQLDNIGEIVVEPRAGRNDADYREALKFRIFVNNSKGRFSDILSYVEQVTSATYVRVREVPPAKITVFTNGTVLPVDLKDNIDGILAGGVGIDSIRIISDGRPFSFQTNDAGAGHFGEVDNLNVDISSATTGEFVEAI